MKDKLVNLTDDELLEINGGSLFYDLGQKYYEYRQSKSSETSSNDRPNPALASL